MIALLAAAAMILGDPVCVSSDPCVPPTWYVLRLNGEDMAANQVEPLFVLTAPLDPVTPGLYEYRIATIDNLGRAQHAGQPFTMCVSREVDCWLVPAEAGEEWVCEPERTRFRDCCVAIGGCP